MSRWREVTLGEIATVGAGNSAPQDKALFEGGVHPFIRTADVGQVRFGEIDSSRDYLNERGIKKLKRFERGTILFPKSGASTFLNHRVIMEVDGYAASHLATIKADNDIADDRFLLYYLSTVKAQDLIQDHKYPSLNLPVIRGIQVALPPLAEQKRIVSLLDAAFAAIDTATTHAQQNLTNARELFESHVHRQLRNAESAYTSRLIGDVCELYQGLAINKNSKHLIVAESALPLLRICDLRDGTAEQFVAPIGFPKNAEVFPHDIIYTRTGQIGMVFRGRRGVLHNNSFKIVPSTEIDADYLYWWLQEPEFRNRIVDLASRAAQPDITHRLFKSQSIVVPPLAVQRRAAESIARLRHCADQLAALYTRKLELLAELKQSILHKAFSGELTADAEAAGEVAETAAPIPFPAVVDGISTTDLHAAVLALAYRRHEAAGRLDDFGHVKGEKIAHMIEAHVGIDLGRDPVKDAAGPNDFPHLKKVEHRARMAGFFSVKRRGRRYELSPLAGFDRLVNRARERLDDRLAEVEQLIGLMLPMDTIRAEIFATVYAAWNNLLLDGREPSDEQIVREARENWHRDKLDIPRERFFKAIEWAREKGFVPRGMGKRVVERPR